MADQSYRQTGLVLQRGGTASPQQVRDLQRDLRALGYLYKDIDGIFGSGTEAALQALSHDLLHNDGSGSDGPAPIAVRDYNRGRVATVTGACDEAFAACIGDLLDEPAFGRVPAAENAAEANAALLEELSGERSEVAPMPFQLGIFEQESGGKHYREPSGGNEDNFVVVGLDRNDSAASEAVTSRGYGIGQYTFFHHPPSRDEIAGRVDSPSGNVEAARSELRAKFDGFVNGSTSGTRADDRIAEVGTGPLRLCRYPAGDARYMSDCLTCLRQAGAVDIREGEPVYEGSTTLWAPTQYYASASYSGVPRRAAVGCDWPYAVRRYNGSGINSYHYQARVLLHMLQQG
ncbi:Putative peptidoglycan binding domain-containing protein [Tistlia consotensis]|uniref:Putative peptidoglycan binding domain-containing protein n=1 Tax=Tistlia consotensis USBA 355 TaxID=560819 RepID=A0A1Y6CFQ5_9PROT|nr:peptidoglycan-binding domain-containing protein [Tistlia consotensis]SMF60909.1 Putative peptidoglycan binding domain-containing protein [Tistlia consotensis USBA 355]SNR92480.1 Putative peptidoglycan binding domain-containing protein [Tistlia consotensis]